MKRLHRKDLFTWSEFVPRLNLDFNSFFWQRDGGNIAIDPLPLSAHDRAHVVELGGIAEIVISNSMHVRGAQQIAAEFGSQLIGPRGESEQFPIRCSRFVGDHEEIVAGLQVFEMAGSKTPGELALVLERTTLIAGDLIRAHRADALMLLHRDQGLKDEARALDSVQRLLDLGTIDTVLVGDGWHVFRHAAELLQELVASGRAKAGK